MSEAIAQSSAFKIYICNVMTQRGETDGYTASKHLKALIEHAQHPKVVHACLLNDAQPPSEALERYKNEDQYPVAADVDKIRAMGYDAVATDLLGVSDFVRHDSSKLNQALIKLIEKHRVIKR